MRKLPLLISVPHAGTMVPADVRENCLLSEVQIIKDGDEQAREIYDFSEFVSSFLIADIPRAIVDLNRAPDDFRSDGVIKTETVFREPVYKTPLSADEIDNMLQVYYYPYHQRLTELSSSARFGIDCHTMLAVAPAVGPNPGSRRPSICISNGDGLTCSENELKTFIEAVRNAFGDDIGINEPFKGGYIIRLHASELPWIQLEVSRGNFMTVEEKRQAVLKTLTLFCEANSF